MNILILLLSVRLEPGESSSDLIVAEAFLICIGVLLGCFISHWSSLVFV